MLAVALQFLLGAWMLLDFLTSLNFGASKGSFAAPSQCQSSAGGTGHNVEKHPLAFSRGLPHRVPISPLIIANDVFFSMRDPPFPFCKGCDKQMLTAPCRGLTFRRVLLSRAGSQIRGNLTSRSGSAKESYFRHSSVGYLKRQSCSIPCMLQDPFQAPGFGCGSARGCLPAAIVCGPAPPQSTRPSRRRSLPLQRARSKKLCELLHDPALPDEPAAPFPSFLYVLSHYEISLGNPQALHLPPLVPSQMQRPGAAPTLA